MTISWFYCSFLRMKDVSFNGYYTAVKLPMLKIQVRVPPQLGEPMQNLN
jgi:hypothetical protein